MRRRTKQALVTLCGGLATYVFALRPWHLRWGATEAELIQCWPGDEMIPHPRRQVTHAITIAAPAATVWALIVQIGQDRAGYYSYSWLENLFGADIHNIDRIVPEYQQRQVGDIVWMAPKDRYGGQGRMVVALLEPGKSMVLVDPESWDISQDGEAAKGLWAFHVREIDNSTTRLVIRGSTGEKSRGADLMDYLFWEPAHFFMERKMMLTVRELAEREARGLF
jgi:hypothetical protein